MMNLDYDCVMSWMMMIGMMIKMKEQARTTEIMGDTFSLCNDCYDRDSCVDAIPTKNRCKRYLPIDVYNELVRKL